ncbi:MAG: ArnT family glycosyltransferase [Bacillota bacterium]
MTVPTPRPDSPADNTLSEPSHPNPNPPSPRRSAVLGLLGVFLIGLLWGTFYLHHWGLMRSLAWGEEPYIGQHLALGHGFLTPYDPSPTASPTSWSPPIYPFILAGVYRVLGINTPATALALGLLNATCFGLVGAGLALLGRSLFWPAVGYLAAAGFYLHPMFLHAVGVRWDHYVALALFVWLINAALALRRGHMTALRITALGAGLAALVLTNTSYLLTIPAIVLVAIRSPNLREMLRMGTLALAGFALAIAPWTIRNCLEFRQPIFVRAGAPFELWFGNLPYMTGWLNRYSFWRDHPGENARERHVLLSMGETAYFAYCKQRFWENYHQAPRAFWHRTLNRTVYLFLSNPTDPARYPFMRDSQLHGYVIPRLFVNTLLTTLGLLGAWMAWRLRYRTHALLGIALLSVVPFIPTAVWDRHTLPLRMILVLLAAFLLLAALHRYRRGAWPTPP